MYNFEGSKLDLGRTVNEAFATVWEGDNGRMDKGRVIRMERNGWKRINRTWSYTGRFPESRSHGMWERADSGGEITVLL